MPLSLKGTFSEMDQGQAYDLKSDCVTIGKLNKVNGITFRIDLGRFFLSLHFVVTEIINTII